jgi:hypothetical protein
MSQQRLFDVGKVGVFLEGYSPAQEKRRNEIVTVMKLSCRVAPFDAKLAGAIDNGVGESSNVRPTLFRLDTTDTKPHLERVNFSLGCPRQTAEVFASSDTQAARILFDQVKVSGVYARTQKDRNGYDLCFKLTFGPCGRDELEYLHSWFLGQRFVTFKQAEPLMEFDSEDTDEEDEEPIATERPKPMWDEPPAAAASAAEPANRKLHQHKPKGKANGKGAAAHA